MNLRKFSPFLFNNIDAIAMCLMIRISSSAFNHSMAEPSLGCLQMTLLKTQHQGKNELCSLYHSKGQAASEILVLTRIIISKSCADAKESRRNPYCLRKAFRSTLLSPLTEIRSSCRFLSSRRNRFLVSHRIQPT